MVLVLRAATEAIFDRLGARGYSEHKREENLEVEIMGVVEEAAREAYDDGVVVVRENNNIDEMMSTVEFVAEASRAFVPPMDRDAE